MGKKSTAKKNISSNNSLSLNPLKWMSCFKAQPEASSVKVDDIPPGLQKSEINYCHLLSTLRNSNINYNSEDVLKYAKENIHLQVPNKVAKSKKAGINQKIQATKKADISLTPNLQKPAINHFPSDVLKWMKENANPKMAIKLMQICKYFQQETFPCNVLNGITRNKAGNWDYSYPRNAFCTAKTLDKFRDNSIWIKEYLYLNQKVEFSTLLSKIAFCHAKHFFCDSQNITIDELKALNACSSFVKVTFQNTHITEKNGDCAALEEVLPCLSNVKNLIFKNIVPSFESCTAATKVTLPKLNLLELHLHRKHFDTQIFNKFKETHPSVRCRINNTADKIFKVKKIILI